MSIQENNKYDFLDAKFSKDPCLCICFPCLFSMIVCQEWCKGCCRFICCCMEDNNNLRSINILESTEETKIEPLPEINNDTKKSYYGQIFGIRR